MNFARYAVYFSPKNNSNLHSKGSRWLGRDVVSGESSGDDVHGRPQWVAIPRRYGFHATLKAPMRLKEGPNAEQFIAAVEKFAESQNPFSIGFLNVAKIGNFLALIPAEKSDRLQEFAFKIVRVLDKFRAPLNKGEIARRGDLSDNLKENLERWGYPYVGPNFRFHMTLTGQLDAEELDLAEASAKEYFDTALEFPVQIDNVCLFGDPGKGEDFKLVRQFALQWK